MKINTILNRGDRICHRGWPSFHDAELRRQPIGRARLWCVWRRSMLRLMILNKEILGRRST
jgi:hypothetical protein